MQVENFSELDAALDTLTTAVDAVVSAAAGEKQTTQVYQQRKARAILQAEKLARLTGNSYNWVRELREHM